MKSSVVCHASHPPYQKDWKKWPCPLCGGVLALSFRAVDSNVACDKLHSDDQISAIAENCGIPDEFYFSRLFKKYYNLPPLTYRREFKPRP